MLLQPACKSIFAQCHFDHGCTCGEFSVRYELVDSGDGEQDFGNVDVSCEVGCESCDKYDTNVGRKKVVEKNKCFTKIKIWAKGTTSPSKCDCGKNEDGECRTCGEHWTSSPVATHNGLTMKFTDSDNKVLSDIFVDTQNSPVEISYCEIYSEIADAF
jgi:hypothetical protein